MEPDGPGLDHLGADGAPVVDELPVALEIEPMQAGGARVARGLPGVPVSGDDEPAVCRQVHPMNAHLVHLPCAGEATVQEQEDVALVLVGPGRDVAGRHVSGTDALCRPIAEAVVAQELRGVRLDGRVVEQRQVRIRLRLAQVLPGRVEIRARDVARSAQAHVVPACGVQTPEGQQQVVVAAPPGMEDVRRFDAGMVPADQVGSVALAGQGPSGVRIQLEQEDAAGIGAVDQSVAPFGVDERVRVDGVRMDPGVVDRAVLARLVPHP